jgi:tetratricopeptide (TPR) repeat protein
MPTPTRSAVSFAAEAEEHYWAGELDAAIAAYRQALDLTPDVPEHYVALGRLLVFRGHPEQGLDMVRLALRLNPDHARAWALRCLAYDWLGMPEEGLNSCERAIALDPAMPEAYAYRAEAYVDLGNWIQANNDIDKALQLADANVDVLRNAGYVSEVQGNYSQAIEYYSRALERHPALSHILLAEGRNYEALNNYQRAEELYLEATRRDPGSVAAWDTLGWSNLLRGEYDEAQEYLNAALERDPNYWQALGHLGTYQFQQRNYEGAIPRFEDALRYGEGASRRRTVQLDVTLEPIGQIGDAPTGELLATGAFLHPADVTYPMRAMLKGTENYATIDGYARLTPLDGQYVIVLEGVPDPPPDQVYVGWFRSLETPERALVRTPVLTPDREGRIELSDATGPVFGPPIEYYYTLGLCHYFLDQCDQAMPYIRVALRIDPNDANALQTLQLCGG